MPPPAKTTYTKASCPFCEWSGRTYRLPYHYVAHHIEKVHLRPTPTEHCIFAYVLHKKEELGFCLCLTCNKGTSDTGFAANGSRWVTMHAKQLACKEAHPSALKILKQKMNLVEDNTSTCQLPPVTIDPYMRLWADCKSKRALQHNLESMETKVRS